MNVFDFSAKSIDGEEVSFTKFRGQVLLIVNVASRCGFTPQYDALEKLHEKYQSEGFAVLGFPCNQFGAQEPGSEADIKSFCELNYKVKFPMFSKVDVNGDNAHPIYKFLTQSQPGILGTESIKWNFTKFLVDSQGQPIKRYASAITPESIESDIQGLLAKEH